MRQLLPWFFGAALVLIIAALASLARHQASGYQSPKQLYAQAIADNPDSWLLHHTLGCKLLDEGDTKRAAAELYRAEEIHSDPESLTSLSVCAMLEGNYQQAIDNADKALALSPKHIGALNNKAAALQMLGRL